MTHSRALPQIQPSYHDPDPSWRQFAACKGIDPELFYGKRGSKAAMTAKQVCKGCDVKGECLEFALRTHQKFGVWGGYTTEEFRRIRRERRKMAMRGSQWV